ncbi:hypothetical protein E7T06_16020 [Deinococcus sp. Arct2-2]|uniref:hypothetical protein n=1 Tax=Deinococcus sp. Arct2-2 TaxID=2568653 RepID=UPI0010A58FB8|nr:hypothetical protein [Deinococcus sp. Arct2-2]THF68522.1 hypothetical protein E7T06_16020 [Deinococcus sp. Arct2-2]
MPFDVHQHIFNARGELDDDARLAYQQALITQFHTSPEGQAYFEGNDAPSTWTDVFLTYAATHGGATPPQMTVADFDHVLLDIFPRQVSTTADSAPDIVAELQAFWRFLSREYALPLAPEILEFLDGEAVELLTQELDNPEHFGPAKRMMMLGLERGFDLTTEAGIHAWMQTYNAELAQGRGIPIPLRGERTAAASKAHAKMRRNMAKASRKKNRKKK